MIASKLGGLKESTLGVCPLIDVQPLYLENNLFKESDNDVSEWLEWIDMILREDDIYTLYSHTGRSAANSFLERNPLFMLASLA